MEIGSHNERPFTADGEELGREFNLLSTFSIAFAFTLAGHRPVRDLRHIGLGCRASVLVELPGCLRGSTAVNLAGDNALEVVLTCSTIAETLGTVGLGVLLLFHTYHGLHPRSHRIGHHRHPLPEGAIPLGTVVPRLLLCRLRDRRLHR